MIHKIPKTGLADATRGGIGFATADFDNDGNKDIVYASPNGIRILYNNKQKLVSAQK